ncbi:deoxyguanosinetriphosphate triphosphohydrolase (dGTPase) [Capnocytophaga sp. oral taxon 338 str. F0234]|nr:deoxyguanosinetriphosphate triphosphohydrolase (dGTPase) [Capnocytophaga sp. oral taxon 338 str. F0234]
MMDWQHLLSLRKQGDKNTRLRSKEDPTRLSYDVDYDRIVFSGAFRSLQDKTQVIPLSGSGFVHTRLTHSMEVSVVGRSLGRAIGAKVLQKYPYLKELGYQMNDFGTIVASAALAHDIGNPPFGHSGEKAIGDFFRYHEGSILKGQISEREYADLCNFEGNANGFKILTESRAGVQGGLRLTYATLGTFIKYPKESLPVKPTKAVFDKKYNIFQSNKEFFYELAQELSLLPMGEGDELRYVRHPLAFLVEAADDICYTLIDFEDGINLGWIPEDNALEYLIQLIRGSKIAPENITHKYYQLAHKQDRIAYLRALSIGTLITEVTTLFEENEESLLRGDFTTALLDKSKYKNQINDIIDLSINNIYQSSQVVEKELAGYAILQHLLRVYFTAVYHNWQGSTSSYDHIILKTIPSRYLSKQESLYECVLSITCYIASLTDTQTTKLHSKLIGIL